MDSSIYWLLIVPFWQDWLKHELKHWLVDQLYMLIIISINLDLIVLIDRLLILRRGSRRLNKYDFPICQQVCRTNRQTHLKAGTSTQCTTLHIHNAIIIVWWIDWLFNSAEVTESFDIDKLFEIVASGEVERLHGLKDYLYKTMKPLSHSVRK